MTILGGIMALMGLGVSVLGVALHEMNTRDAHGDPIDKDRQP